MDRRQLPEEVVAMPERHVNYSTGSDAADGLTAATAWKTIAKLNTESAGFGGATTVYLYGTDAAPLWMDAPLRVRGNMAAVGVGDRTLTITDRDGIDRVASTTAADLRPFKVLTGPYTRPDAAGAPNCWQTSDTELTAVLFRWGGWSGNAQPLVVLDHPTGTVVGTMQTTVSGLVDSFWTNGTVMLFHSTTDPNTNGVTYVRTQPAAFMDGVNGVYGAILDGAAPALDNVCIGGTTHVAAANSTLFSGYACVVRRQTSGVYNLTRCLFYHGTNHALGLYVASGGTSNWTSTVRDCRWEQGAPWSGASHTPHVDYFESGSGNRSRYHNCQCERNTGLVGSVAGTNNVSLQGWYAHTDGTTGQLSELTLDGLRIGHGTLITDQVVIAGGGKFAVTRSRIARARVRDSASWTACRFYHFLPHALVAGTTQTFRHCLIEQTSGQNQMDNVNPSATFDIRYCTVDLRGGTALTAMVNKTSGTLVFTFRNNLVLHGSTANVPVLTGVVTGDTLDFNYNRYASTVTASTRIMTFNAIGYALAGMQGLGHDTNSAGEYAAGAYTNLYLNSTRRPTAGSPFIGSGETLATAPDYMGAVFAVRNDPGAFQYATNPRRRRAGKAA